MGERNTLFLSCSYTKNSQIPYESFLMKVLAVIIVQWIVVRMDAEILGERCSTSTVQCNQNSMQCYVAFLLLFIFFSIFEIVVIVTVLRWSVWFFVCFCRWPENFLTTVRDLNNNFYHKPEEMALCAVAQASYINSIRLDSEVSMYHDKIVCVCVCRSFTDRNFQCAFLNGNSASCIR